MKWKFARIYKSNSFLYPFYFEEIDNWIDGMIGNSLSPSVPGRIQLIIYIKKNKDSENQAESKEFQRISRFFVLKTKNHK